MTAPTTSGHGLTDVSDGVASDARLEVTAGPVGKGKPDEARREASEIKHGTPTAYFNRGCRCVPCRTSARDYRREHRHRRAAAAAELLREAMSDTRICPRCGAPIQVFLFGFHLARAHGVAA